MSVPRRAAWPFCVCDFGPFARGGRHYSASITTSRGVGNIGTKRRSSEQEVQRGASTSLFASGASAAEAREALRRVDGTVEAAELVRFIVRTQAASALKDTGMTDRAMGAAIGLSKSNINRLLAGVSRALWVGAPRRGLRAGHQGRVDRLGIAGPLMSDSGVPQLPEVPTGNHRLWTIRDWRGTRDSRCSSAHRPGPRPARDGPGPGRGSPDHPASPAGADGRAARSDRTRSLVSVTFRSDVPHAPNRSRSQRRQQWCTPSAVCERPLPRPRVPRP